MVNTNTSSISNITFTIKIKNPEKFTRIKKKVKKNLKTRENKKEHLAHIELQNV